MHYRDDRHALESRRDDLRKELREITEKAEALRAVVEGQEAIALELAETEARLAHLDARRASLLDNVRIASPCKASWEAMTGDDRARFCGECKKNVYDLSAMSREEATRLLIEREGNVCVRLYRRADGTVLTSDCSVGVRRKRVKLAILSTAGAGMMATAGLAAASMCMMGKPAVTMGAPVATPPAEMLGEPALPDHYVSLPLATRTKHGLVVAFRREGLTEGAPGETWQIFVDGSVDHLVDGRPAAHNVTLSPDGDAAVRSILAFAAELRPEAEGAVAPHADSTIRRRYDLYGVGSRAATDDDRMQLFNLAGSLAVAPAP